MGIRWSDTGDRRRTGNRDARKPGGGVERRKVDDDRDVTLQIIAIVVVVVMVIVGWWAWTLPTGDDRDRDVVCWDALTVDDLEGDCPVTP